MMKKIKTLIRISLIAVAMVFAAGTAQIIGAAGAWNNDTTFAGADEAFAASDYTYTVSIYSGKEGYFDGDENKHVIRAKNLKYGQEYTVDLADLDLTVIDPDKYYVRGAKRSGHDNDEVSQLNYQSYTFTVTKDESFSIAYGMAGGMVQYTVNYVDENGQALLASQNYYGMAGDKPVVSYKYVEGYQADDYNLTKTLSDNEAENVFTFTYHKNGAAVVTTEEEENGGEDEGDNGNANGNNAGNAGNANGNGTLTAGNGDNVPGTGITDLDENATPMAGTDIEDNETPGGILSGANALVAGIVGAGILIALAILYFLFRRKRSETEE